jgi:ketosteroid isomerase-like protein
MDRSAEVEAAATAMLDAMRRGDGAAAAGLMASDVSAVIGTDDGEWWDGREAATTAVTAQLEALGGFPLDVEHLRGYGVEGFGWFETRGSLVVDDGSVSVRMTGALRHEDDGWKFLQIHASVGTPNADLGMADLPV